MTKIKGIVAAACLCASVFAGATSLSASDGWMTDEFNIVIRGQDLREVLSRFGVLAGVPVVLSDGVQATVSARFEQATGQQIIEALAREYALDWRFDGRRLEVSSNTEQVSRILDLGGVSRSSIVDSLVSLGVYDEKFPVTVTDGDLAFVVGPPRYVGLVEVVLAELVERANERRDREAQEAQSNLAQIAMLRKLLEENRVKAVVPAAKAAPKPKPLVRSAPLINRGGRWGG